MNKSEFFDGMQEASEIHPATQSLDSTIAANQQKKSASHLRFIANKLSSHLLKVSVEINSSLIDMILTQSIELFKQGTIDGFEPSNIPSEYIKDVYHNEITSKTKHYAFYHLIIDFLIQEIIARKITIANYPRLTTIEIGTDKTMAFHFDVSTADQLELKEWKHFAFKSPKRKRYKDLDKQVISFMESKSASPRKQSITAVSENDWVLLDVVMLDKNELPISTGLNSTFWFRVGKRDIAEPFSMQLIDKEVHTSFNTKHFITHKASDKDTGQTYSFLVTIKTIIKESTFSLDTFKNTFKLKNKSEIHNKLMEVFSYRNDVSQRKAIIEEIFHLLLSKHRFEVPKHLVLRREEDIVHTLSQQPDYHVYKAQKDFDAHIEMLAEKQLKEEIIIDQIAYRDNIKVDTRDTVQYLHLILNKRLKEFIYFKPIFEKIDDPTGPINISTLIQAVMREKTLNYIIHTLTR